MGLETSVVLGAVCGLVLLMVLVVAKLFLRPYDVRREGERVIFRAYKDVNEVVVQANGVRFVRRGIKKGEQIEFLSSTFSSGAVVMVDGKSFDI